MKLEVPPFAMFFISLGCLFGAIATDPNSIVIKHLFWAGFVVSLGFSLFPSIKSMLTRGTFWGALMTTGLIVGIISLYVYNNPDSFITKGWTNTLLWALIAGILFQLVMLISGTFTKDSWNLMATLFVILFTAFLLHDTERVYKRAGMCMNKEINPDYIQESMNLFLDILNIFLYSDRLS
jgi:FtsH-binding integral membrane protein